MARSKVLFREAGAMRPVSSLLAGLIALAVMLHASAASANDSTASLDTGGLKLTFDPDISIQSEDLYLSRDEVPVVSRFHNRSEHDIATLVAFPLPVMIISEEGNYDIQGRDPVNVMDFEVTVDGKRLTPQSTCLEKARLCGDSLAAIQGNLELTRGGRTVARC